MATTLICEGDLTPNLSGGFDCSLSWQVVPYVEPTDSTAIYAQLVALNEFDPSVTALIVSGCLVLFIIGFSAGMVLKRLRTV
jgi:hypothetical protein